MIKTKHYLWALNLLAILPVSAQNTYPSVILADQPIAYWRMGQPPGSPATTDASGHGETAVAIGGVDFGQPGVLPKNTAVDLTGTGYFVSPLVQTAVSQYSLEAWVNTTALQAPILQDRGFDDQTNNNAFSITLTIGHPSSADGALLCGVDGDNVLTGAVTTAGVNDGVWHHLVCVFSGTTGRTISARQFTIYVDGQPAPVTYVNLGSVRPPIAPVTGSGGTTIGIHPIWQEEYNLPKFVGLLDEVAIYNYALSPVQVMNHYNAAQ